MNNQIIKKNVVVVDVLNLLGCFTEFNEAATGEPTEDLFCREIVEGAADFYNFNRFDEVILCLKQVSNKSKDTSRDIYKYFSGAIAKSLPNIKIRGAIAKGFKGEMDDRLTLLIAAEHVNTSNNVFIMTDDNYKSFKNFVPEGSLTYRVIGGCFSETEIPYRNIKKLVLEKATQITLLGHQFECLANNGNFSTIINQTSILLSKSFDNSKKFAREFFEEVGSIDCSFKEFSRIFTDVLHSKLYWTSTKYGKTLKKNKKFNQSL